MFQVWNTQCLEKIEKFQELINFLNALSVHDEVKDNKWLVSSFLPS